MSKTLDTLRVAMREVSPALTCSYDRASGEYRVSFAIEAIRNMARAQTGDMTYCDAKVRNEQIAYYSTDADDALATAKYMVEHSTYYPASITKG